MDRLLFCLFLGMLSTGLEPLQGQGKKPSISVLLVSDLACNIQIDGDAVATMEADGMKKLPIDYLGQHVIIASTLDGKDHWKKLIDINAPGQVYVAIKLKPIREAREAQEAADAADERRRRDAVLARQRAKEEAERRRQAALLAEKKEREAKERALKEAEMRGMEMVFVPQGEYTMGSETGFDDERPPHRVTINSFYMGRYEVTQALWESVLGTNPSRFKGPELPVENVSWLDIQIFLRELNKRQEGPLFRLPTEAEWEYVCRAGMSGDFPAPLDTIAWYEKNSGNRTHPVNTNKPNRWGFFGMYGNVYEWCFDWKSGYTQDAVVDPLGPLDGKERVFRGGGWFFSGWNCRPSKRFSARPGYRSQFLGFRLARDLEWPVHHAQQPVAPE